MEPTQISRPDIFASSGKAWGTPDEPDVLDEGDGGYGDTFYIDEVFVKINGKQRYLWRAVYQESLPHEVLWVWSGG
jgi:hypothetical protein